MDGGSDKPNVSTLRGLKPGSTFQRLTRLRIINPAPVRRTKAIATSTTTKTLSAR
jgi:hypothetical protein